MKKRNDTSRGERGGSLWKSRIIGGIVAAVIVLVMFWFMLPSHQSHQPGLLAVRRIVPDRLPRLHERGGTAGRGSLRRAPRRWKSAA